MRVGDAMAKEMPLCGTYLLVRTDKRYARGTSPPPGPLPLTLDACVLFNLNLAVRQINDLAPETGIRIASEATTSSVQTDDEGSMESSHNVGDTHATAPSRWRALIARILLPASLFAISLFGAVQHARAQSTDPMQKPGCSVASRDDLARQPLNAATLPFSPMAKRGDLRRAGATASVPPR